MYHCHIQFYFIGRQSRIFDRIKDMSPLAHFTHEFSESTEPEAALTAEADVILADVSGMDKTEIVDVLIAEKKQEAELILLAEGEQAGRLLDRLSESLLAQIQDVWVLPMSDSEIGFRFLRWQQTYKMGKDFWQTSQYFETAANNIPNLIWYKDKEGIHKKVNDSFCRTVGKTKQQVEGRGHAYIWDVEQDDPACIESEQEVMRKKKTCISEEIIQTGDGMRTLTTYKSPLYDLDGSVMGTVGVAIDVTQEHAYKQEIIKKNQTLEKIFTTLDCGVMCHTLDGSRILSVNGAALKILGYESQEELMEEGFELIAPSVLEEDREMFQKAFQKLKAENDNINVEYRVRHKNGEILHVMGNIKLLKENGELVYRRFLLDATEQRLQMQKRERQQMELIQALCIDYTLVCFFDLDTGLGFLLRSGGEQKQMFDSVFQGELVLEKSMELYIEKFVYEEDKEMMRQALSTDKLREELGEKALYYVNYRTGGEELKYFQMRAVRAGVWDGSCGIVMGFRNVDIETRNEMEQKDMLEHALLQANKASKAKSVFLSNMSHDIRTPMNAIVGFTTLAITHIEQQEQVEEYLKKIKTSGNHLLNLINDVLDMSRIESGKMQLDEKLCQLPDIVYELRNILQSDIHAKQLKLHIDVVDIQNEEVYCDKLRLNQVLLNLLSNAVKYTEDGGTIHMLLREKTGAPVGYASYEICIKDTGIGMSEEFVSHIFEPFEREKSSTISGIQGTGLGMAITKNIVDMMNGTISVKSEQGVGTEVTVSFAFRLHDGEIEPKDALESKGTRQSAAEQSGENEKEGKEGKRGRILLAEDNELNQEIAEAILEDAGFLVEIAENGQIAVEMLNNSEPGYYRIVLMDVQMPVMNGYEATRQIRQLENEELATVPILAMTANAFEEDKKEAIKCGMNGHLAKPIDIGKLLAALEEILG